jgi:predicted extracellular nuclease
MRRFVLAVTVLVVLIGGASSAIADTTAQPLPFSQDWTSTGLITTNDDWSGVAGIVGYLGDDASTSANDVDPQTRVEASWSLTADVIANQTNPNITNGGVAEFQLANPVVALQGSGTADAPNAVLSLDTTGKTGIAVSYSLRDIDGSADNAVQQVALQFRIGSSGSFTSLAAGYVADATTGPGLATQVTPVAVTLPATADNQPLVQVRIITTNATGSDEWVGIDDISVAAGSTPQPDVAPTVTSTTPANGSIDVARNANVGITFSEPVLVANATFTITCASSGAHPLAASGGTTTYTLDPDTDFAVGETCTVTVDDQGVNDVDTVDPPDTMAADFTFSFTTAGIAARTFQIQGAAHTSPLNGQVVSAVPGVVTSVRPNSFTMQDASGDGSNATSDAILVFGTGIGSSVTVGQAVTVSGRVTEFRPGGAASANLTTTELTSPTVTPGGPGAAIAQTVVGLGGRTPPTSVIDVETSGNFDPATDGIDFYESLEAMLLRVNDPVVVGPRNDFGELWVLADNGAGAGIRTLRQGIVVGPTDFNPERIQLEDDIVLGATPAANVSDRFTTAAVGVLDYNFGNFELQLTSALTRVDSGLAREVTRPQAANELAIATFNVENLSPVDPPAKFARLADLIVDNLRAPDIVALEEIQDNDGPANTAVTDATLTLQQLIAAIQATGGPVYQFRQIDPVDDQDGGQPGGNIRVGFLYRTDRGLAFVDRPGATSVTPNAVTGRNNNVQLQYSPGRIDPLNPAWAASRKPLAAEFRYRGQTVFVIVNHFNSKGGDQPLYGRFQPPARPSEVQRHQQAQLVNDFVDEILAAFKNARIVVLGDINDFEFSRTVEILKGGALTNLMDTLPKAERYSYVFEGNSQVLDQVLVSEKLDKRETSYDVVHVNAEFFDQASDHDPQVARFLFDED